MNISGNGISQLQKYEGLSLKPYRDAGGLWTIGYGHLIKSNESYLMSGVTTEQARKLFIEDIAISVNRVNKYIKVPLKQWEFDALVSWDFNTGKIHKTELTEMINAGAPVETVYRWWISHYLTASGNPSPGLVTRRNDEAKMYAGNVPVGPTGLPVMELLLFSLALYLFTNKKPGKLLPGL